MRGFLASHGFPRVLDRDLLTVENDLSDLSEELKHLTPFQLHPRCARGTNSLKLLRLGFFCSVKNIDGARVWASPEFPKSFCFYAGGRKAGKEAAKERVRQYAWYYLTLQNNTNTSSSSNTVAGAG